MRFVRIINNPRYLERHFGLFSQRLGSTVFPVIVILLSVAGSLWVDAWQWSYFDITNGQPWRLVSGHFAHGNLWHWLWNGVAFVLLTGFASPSMRGYLGYIAFLGLCLWVGLAIFWWLPMVGIYRGLSGVLHGWAVLCIAGAIGWPWRIRAVMLMALCLKLGWDFQAPGSTPSYLGSLEGSVLPAAHALGALGGFIIFPFFLLGAYLCQKSLRGIR